MYHSLVDLLRHLRGGREPRRQARLERAVVDLDRELAANLELTSLFDQTRQAVVFENGEYARHRATLEREAPAAFALVADVYARVGSAEAAMERRGPAGTFPEADRAIVEGWEGDARAAQAALRGALAPPPSLIKRALARLHGERPTGR